MGLARVLLCHIYDVTSPYWKLWTSLVNQFIHCSSTPFLDTITLCIQWSALLPKSIHWPWTSHVLNGRVIVTCATSRQLGVSLRNWLIWPNISWVRYQLSLSHFKQDTTREVSDIFVNNFIKKTNNEKLFTENCSECGDNHFILKFFKSWLNCNAVSPTMICWTNSRTIDCVGSGLKWRQFSISYRPALVSVKHNHIYQL